MTSEADEYEALWRKAFEEYLRHPDSIDASNQAAAAILRDHVEAKLAEVRAVDQHFINQCELKAHNATVTLTDRDRTIAEQAAELAKLREAGAKVAGQLRVMLSDDDAPVSSYEWLMASERFVKAWDAALGGSNAK